MKSMERLTREVGYGVRIGPSARDTNAQRTKAAVESAEVPV